MRFYANDILQLRNELERAFDDLDNPGKPSKLFARDEADLPPAADWTDCVVFVSDLGVAAVSDGTNWVGIGDGVIIV